MTRNLTVLWQSLQHNTSTKYANAVLHNLAKDKGFYGMIRDYRHGQFIPKNVAVKRLQNSARNEDVENAKLNKANAARVAKYANTDWINYITLKPVTKADVDDIITNALM